MYDYLFSPIKINQIEIKNRIAYPSLGLLFSYDRKLNDRYYNFFAEISEGGAGIVTVGPVGVDHIGSGLATLGLDNDEAIPTFKKLTGIIKKGGARPWIQLFHGGAYVYPFLIDNKQPIAPSPIFSNIDRYLLSLWRKACSMVLVSVMSRTISMAPTNFSSLSNSGAASPDR